MLVMLVILLVWHYSTHFSFQDIGNKLDVVHLIPKSKHSFKLKVDHGQEFWKCDGTYIEAVLFGFRFQNC